MINLDIIKSTYEGESAEENSKNLQKYITDTTLWTESAGFPYAGIYQGYDQIYQQVFAKLRADWINYTFTPENYIAASNMVVAYGTYSAVNKATGKAFKARVAHIWVLENKKIISFEQIVDSQPVVEAMEK